MSSKTKRNHEEFLAAIEPVRQQLESFRQSRSHRGRLPEELWEAIAGLGRGFGVNRVCRALRVDYYGLKRRVQGSPAQDQRAFIEVPLSASIASAGDVVELEDRQGRKMTLRLSPAHRGDALALVQSFWKGQR